MGTTSTCRYCGAPLKWFETTAGRRMPLNRDPDPNGNVVIVEGKAQVLSTSDLLARLGTRGRFMPHQATCTGRPRSRRRNPSRERSL